MNPKVAIVIVNWNKKDFVTNLLNSLRDIDYDNYDIAVVDNASTDGSVEAIKAQFPGINLIVNTENLGGTGGFNTGLRYALEKGGYKYIWLLDNDVEVEKDALKELADVMEEDERIGIAGSRINDFDRRDITIEAGAFLSWKTINVKPLYRNKKNPCIKSKIEDVDYVAICSALIRVSAVYKVGLLDERYFIFWDDMDWGLQFNRNGYRVIAVLSSVIYHPAFTEKRNDTIDFYYGNRNALLTYAKHAGALNRLSIFFNFLRHTIKGFIFLGLTGKKYLMFTGFAGLYDFLAGKWGNKILKNIDQECQEKGDHPCNFPKKINRIIILSTGNRSSIYEVLNKLKTLYPEAAYTLLIEDDREEMFKDSFHHIIRINRNIQYKSKYLLFIFLKILFNNYHIAVNPKHTSPFSFAVRRVYNYNHVTEKIHEDKNNNLNNIWKLIFSTCCGEVLTLFLLPIVYIRSFKYRKS